MSNTRSLAAITATGVVVLLAAGCETRPTAVAPSIGTPQAHFGAPVCTPFKITGGGRIDYPPGSTEKNPPSSHIFESFGAHVIASGQEVNGTCGAEKGSLEWVDHRPEFNIGGSPLNIHSLTITFAEAHFQPETDCSDGGAHWGGTARVQNTGETADFEVYDCDNGEPGSSDGFGIRVFPVNGQLYEVLCFEESLPPAEPACTLTGGNRQFHPTH